MRADTDPSSTLRAAHAGEARSTPNDLQPMGVARRLRLDAGRNHSAFPFRSREPLTHTTTLMLSAPTAARLEVWFETQESVRLDIIRDVREDQACRPVRRVRRCMVTLPILEARAPGIWTAHVRKSSRPAADVVVTITSDHVD